MAQEIFNDFSRTAVLGGCVLLVVIITSFIHHLVGKNTRWWNLKWGSFLFSVFIGMIAHLRFIEMIEPTHIVVIIGNIGLIYFAAVGFNAAVGKPAILSFTDTEQASAKGLFEETPPKEIKETWRTRWFD